MRVGSELRAAREKAGITVEVISRRTNIKVSKLVALEKNDFKNLPTGLYLFSTVRAYAREVHIDPEPIVERLRAEFADKDAVDALHALDATGALDAKTLADARRSKEEQSNLLRNAAIAAGAVLMAAAGAGTYLHNMRSAHEVRSTKGERPSVAPTVNSPNETPSVSLSSPAPSHHGCNCGRCAAASCACSPQTSANENQQAETANCCRQIRTAGNRSDRWRRVRCIGLIWRDAADRVPEPGANRRAR